MRGVVGHGVHCILPPHMVDQIARNGSPGQRDRALNTLAVDHSLRVARVGATLTPEDVPTVDVASVAALAPVKQVTIYDAEEGSRLPGRRVRGEGDPPSPTDVAVNEAFDYISDTWDFYLAAYDRNSLDGNGLPLNGSVHYQHNYDNAFWDGKRMVFGDGDDHPDVPPNQRTFERFTKCIDVIGHELTHGVTESEAGLIYWSQPGALNESISDVFGSLVKQFVNNEKADQADWLIGEGLLAPQVQGEALRSMKAPGTAYDDDVLGKDPQPAHMDDYVPGIQDNGGVHINSGIPNHAFYLAATNIGGFAWETTGLIWYTTLLSPFLRRTAKFLAFAKLTVFYAGSLYPGTDTAAAVSEAWREVGINA